MRTYFKISTDADAPDATLGAFADLAEEAFNQGLHKYSALEDEANPYIIFTMLVSVIGTLAQKFLQLSYVMSSDYKDDEMFVKSAQSDVWDSAINLLAFTMTLLFKLRGTIENEHSTDENTD